MRRAGSRRTVWRNAASFHSALACVLRDPLAAIAWRRIWRLSWRRAATADDVFLRALLQRPAARLARPAARWDEKLPGRTFANRQLRPGPSPVEQFFDAGAGGAGAQRCDATKPFRTQAAALAFRRSVISALETRARSLRRRRQGKVTSGLPPIVLAARRYSGDDAAAGQRGHSRGVIGARDGDRDRATPTHRLAGFLCCQCPSALTSRHSKSAPDAACGIVSIAAFAVATHRTEGFSGWARQAERNRSANFATWMQRLAVMANVRGDSGMVASDRHRCRRQRRWNA